MILFSFLLSFYRVITVSSKRQTQGRHDMTYDIFDQGFAITLVRNDGETVCLQGDDATYFREEYQDCPSDWSVTRYITEVGYDMLFEG